MVTHLTYKSKGVVEPKDIVKSGDALKDNEGLILMLED